MLGHLAWKNLKNVQIVRVGYDKTPEGTNAMDDIQELKRMAVNAMTGHLTIADPVYELGKALEAVCEEVERLLTFEEKATDNDEAITELEDVVKRMKERVKVFAMEMEAQ